MLKKAKGFKREVISGLFLLLLLSTLSANLFSYFCLNAMEGAFLDPGKDAIRLHQIKGSGNFFKSHAIFLLFLEKIECAEIETLDYRELKNLLIDTITYLESARNHYYALQQIADVTPYNLDFLAKLMSYDFYRNRQTIQESHSQIEEIKSYLMDGNLRGINYQFIFYLDGLLLMLYDIQTSVENDMFPEIPNLLQIQSSYCQIQLWGQFAAKIFMQVVGK